MTQLSNYRKKLLWIKRVGVELHHWVFPGSFDQSSNMCTSIIMQENHFAASGVVVGVFFLECSAQSLKLCLINNLSNGTIINDTNLILPNTHGFFPEIFACLLMFKHDHVLHMIYSSAAYGSTYFFSPVTIWCKIFETKM